MNLPLNLVKKINQEAYSNWTTTSAVASDIIKKSGQTVLNSEKIPTQPKTSTILKTSFRPLLPKELTECIESQIGQRQFTNFFIACCNLYFNETKQSKPLVN